MKVVFLLLCPVILNADSLILKSGTAVSGTYAGGDARSIRFVVGDQVKVFSINDVDRLVFESGTAVSEGRSSANSTRDRSGAEESSTVSAPAAPEKQRRFCELMQDYRAANMRYTNEPNPIKRADMRKPDPYDWEQRIVDVFGASGRFDKWTGAVRFHVDGNHIAVSFFPECEKFPQGVEFATAGRYVFGSRDSNTMIPLHSPMAETLRQTNGNQKVIASGHLFYLSHGNLGNLSTGQKGELRQRYKSAPNYPPASVASPRYLAEFDSISLAR